MMPFRLVTTACHAVLIGAVAASALATVTPARITLALMLIAPLLATLRGLVRGHRSTLQLLAVLLVAYIGGASVEVVARTGGALLMNVALLTAALELGLVLALIRRSRQPQPSVHE